MNCRQKAKQDADVFQRSEDLPVGIELLKRKKIDRWRGLVLPLPQGRALLSFTITLVVFLLPLQARPTNEIHFRPQGDSIRMSKGRLLKQQVTEYNYNIIKLALERTSQEYGPFRLTQLKTRVSDLRALHEISKADRQGKIDVHVAITSAERESMMRAIKIPIRFALLSYRLVLVKQENMEVFRKLKSLEDLKRYSTGSGEHWITTEVLDRHKFQVSYIQNTDSIFKMLAMNRFDFILRGVNELYFEEELYAKDFEGLSIVPGIAVYMPTHYYAFVNKDSLRLANRIEEGLKIAVNDGSARALFWEYYGPSINKADLPSRRIISIENHNFINKPITQTPEFWYTHNDAVKDLITSYSQ